MIAASIALAAASAALDLPAFFTGRTHAANVIKIALHSPHRLIVESVGGHSKEGEFVLIDTIREEGKPMRTRTWVMRPAGPGHFTGTLSDAVGPVDIRVNGDTATIRYVMADGRLKIVQQMQMQDGGRVLSNRAVAKKFGLTFARVDGTIRKLD